MGGPESIVLSEMSQRQILYDATHMWASLVLQTVKRPPAMQDTRLNPWVRTIPWRRQWHPTPVLLPGKPHGRRSLVGYSPWGHKESDTTEQQTLSLICGI